MKAHVCRLVIAFFVKVIACNGVVELSGFVNTGVHRNRAGEVTSKVVGVKGVENKLTVRD